MAQAKTRTRKTIGTIKVRKARVGDVAQIVMLARQRDEAKKHWAPGYKRGFSLQLRHVIKAANSHYCWVAVDAEKKILGFAFASMTYSPWENGMWLMLSELYVRPKLRSAGIGKRLMLAVKRASKRSHSRGLFLMTHPHNHGAQKFYRRHKMRIKTMKSCSWAA